VTARGNRVSAVATIALAGSLLAACSSGPSSAPPSSTSTTAPGTSPAPGSPAPTVAQARDSAGTVWLCAPGLADDPCAAPLGATTVMANGSTTGVSTTAAASSAFDCFYVYPTVSTEPSDNADLTVQPAETAAAVVQASRFSQVCRVWAPMYRQRTESSLAKGLGNDPTADAVAYASVLSAWRDYLKNDNDGRPVIVIGHSQGAAMLIRLLRAQVDPDASLRRLLVSAIILGGNVQVPTGADVGGSFLHIPACRSARQTGCVIAYSSFLEQPPANSLFGRPGTGVSLQSDQTASVGMQVLCTNPADLGGGTGALDPYFLSPAATRRRAAVGTPWVEYPDLYTAQCETEDGATWLQVNDIGTAGDSRPRVTETLGPTWGLHLDDVNLALGNLVQIVAQQEGAFTKGRRAP